MSALLSPSASTQPNALSIEPKQTAASNGWRRITRIRLLVLGLPWIGCAWQAVLSQSREDLVCALLAASGAFLLFLDAFRPQRLFRYPLSTVVILGFAITLQLGPLLFTALEGNSITFNLLTPVDTFGHGVLVSLVCIVAHAIYRQSRALKTLRMVLQRQLLRLKIFEPLRSVEVVVMGSIGVFALGLSSWFSGLIGSTELFKFIQGFQFLSIIPTAFLLPKLYSNQAGSNEHAFKRSLTLFLLFMALIVAVSLGRNSRSTFVVPLACLVLGLGLEWLYGMIRIRLAAVLAALLAVLLLLPLATDLATAMVMVRSLRNDIPATELFDETLNQLQDRDAIARYRTLTSEAGLTADWSYTYVSNLFLARFANAKFPDNSLENSARLTSEAGEEMAQYHLLSLVSTFPTPVLNLFGFDQSIKEDVISYSFGDKLYSLSLGLSDVIGGFRTGHFFGTGMAAFGFSYLLFFLFSLLIVFPLVDSHAFVSRRSMDVAPLISVVAITQLIGWFAISNAESVVDFIQFSLRGFIQPILLFALVRYLLARLRLA